MKLASKAVKKSKIVASNNNIINIKKQIDNVRLLMEDKKKGVNTATRETKCKHKGVEGLKLGTRSLLETIEAFLQMASMIRDEDQHTQETAPY